LRKRGREAWEGDQLMAGRAESSVRWNGQSGGMDNLKSKVKTEGVYWKGGGAEHGGICD
jgi:hypothetical protein